MTLLPSSFVISRWRTRSVFSFRDLAGCQTPGHFSRLSSARTFRIVAAPDRMVRIGFANGAGVG